ncbi:MAG: hypothetical protein ACK537_07960 [Pseudomonadota bacterium]|jgi:hypothetical protein
MPTIHRKTAKGLSEVQTRAFRLPPRLRSLLIMVDGKRSDAELSAMLPQAGEVLQALSEQGFIEVAAQASAPPPPPPPPPPPAALQAPRRDAAGAEGSAAAVAVAPAATASTDFPARRRQVLRLFNDIAGPDGEPMAIKMERTRSLEELRALLPQAVNLVGLLRGRGEAQAFADRVDQI